MEHTSASPTPAPTYSLLNWFADATVVCVILLQCYLVALALTLEPPAQNAFMKDRAKDTSLSLLEEMFR